MYEHAEARPWMRRLILSPGRHPEPTALASLLARIRATTQEASALPHVVGAAVVSEAPELAEHALCTCGRGLTTAERLRGVLGLFSHPDRLRALLTPTSTPPKSPSSTTPTPQPLAVCPHRSETVQPPSGLVTPHPAPPPLHAAIQMDKNHPDNRRTIDWESDNDDWHSGRRCHGHDHRLTPAQ
ncbi:hypothetical protein AB0D04_41295 [Streptomyces sp. NPDC048483]|uniref:hypothetical protein n=1 Tax=Streptomyces sp. NPDC048483 TaxID=3154927 RepID=UPI0034310E18